MAPKPKGGAVSAPPPSQQVQEYDPTWGYGNSSPNEAATDIPTAPPPMSETAWINPDWLRSFGKPVEANIESVQAARGGRSDIDQRKGWFVVFVLDGGEKVQGRISEGDHRHVRLYNAFQAQWPGKRVRLRLPNPGDKDSRGGMTKAAWSLDALN